MSAEMFDNIDIKPCLKCCRFNHSEKKFKNNITCLFCSGDHNYCDCKNFSKKEKTLSCTICICSNNKYKTKFKTDHAPNDTINCMILNNKIKKYVSDKEYPQQPDIPRYLGKIMKNKKSDLHKKDNLDLATK